MRRRGHLCSVPASGSSVSHTNADARTDANGVAQPHSYASKHERPHTDVSAREQARTATPVPPPANWITIEQAIQRFSDAGVHRKLRTVQKYCTNERLSSHLALTDVGFNYFVDPVSIEAFIAQKAQMAPLSSDSDLDDGTAPARTAAQPHAQPRPDAPAHRLQTVSQAPHPAPSTCEVGRGSSRDANGPGAGRDGLT